MSSVRTRTRKFDRTLASAKRTMVLSEIVKLAIDSFRANKVRFMLTALGMVIGSASLILVVTIGQTGKQYILTELQGIAPNMVEIEYAGGGASTESQPNFRNDYLTQNDITAVREAVPSVVASSPIQEMHDRISLSNGITKDILVLGVSPEYKKVRNLVVVSGRFFDDEDAASHAKVAVVTLPFALERFGSADAAVDQSFKIKQIPFTIIGVFKEMVDDLGESEIADQTILIPFPVAQYFTGTDQLKQIYFTVGTPGEVEPASRHILPIIQSRHRSDSVYHVRTLTELLTTAALIANALTLGLLLVSAVTLAVGGVGIMNIMLANVRSRIREIGIRKAVGATAREIKLQFLLEAALISLCGGIVGTIIGLAVPFSVRFFTSYRIPIPGLAAIVALSSATLVGVIFGTLPANRAAQMDPVESLRFE